MDAADSLRRRCTVFEEGCGHALEMSDLRPCHCIRSVAAMASVRSRAGARADRGSIDGS